MRPPKIVEKNKSPYRPFAYEAMVKEVETMNVIYERERRDPVWSYKMKTVMIENIKKAQERLNLKDVAIDLVCHSRSCRISLAFNQKDLDSMMKRDQINPNTAIMQEIGDYGTVMYELPMKNSVKGNPFVGIGSNGSFSMVTYAAFDEYEMDPDGYNLDRVETKKLMQANEASLR